MEGVWQHVHHTLVLADRERCGREASTADRFAPLTKRGGKGYDAGKKIAGRKRHILTDTDGRLPTVRVHGADVQDRDGGKLPLTVSRQRFPFVAPAFADGGYAGRLVTWAADKTPISLEIIRRGVHAKGFEVLPHRGIVERTFAWIFKNRRLVRDYQQLTAVAETLITIAASATLIRRPPSLNGFLKRTLRRLGCTRVFGLYCIWPVISVTMRKDRKKRSSVCLRHR